MLALVEIVSSVLAVEFIWCWQLTLTSMPLSNTPLSSPSTLPSPLSSSSTLPSISSSPSSLPSSRGSGANNRSTYESLTSRDDTSDDRRMHCPGQTIDSYVGWVSWWHMWNIDWRYSIICPPTCPSSIASNNRECLQSPFSPIPTGLTGHHSEANLS